uniref:Transposase n=1 Tax=Elaeophora elaphi TaxID=1147741 RepID=A0A0R3RNR3_9BILA
MKPRIGIRNRMGSSGTIKKKNLRHRRHRSGKSRAIKVLLVEHIRWFEEMMEETSASYVTSVTGSAVDQRLVYSRLKNAQAGYYTKFLVVHLICLQVNCFINHVFGRHHLLLPSDSTAAQKVAALELHDLDWRLRSCAAVINKRQVKRRRLDLMERESVTPSVLLTQPTCRCLFRFSILGPTKYSRRMSHLQVVKIRKK